MKIRKMKNISDMPFSISGNAVMPGGVFEMEDNISARELLGNGKAEHLLFVGSDAAIKGEEEEKSEEKKLKGKR